MNMCLNATSNGCQHKLNPWGSPSALTSTLADYQPSSKLIRKRSQWSNATSTRHGRVDDTPRPPDTLERWARVSLAQTNTHKTDVGVFQQANIMDSGHAGGILELRCKITRIGKIEASEGVKAVVSKPFFLLEAHNTH